MLQQLTSPTPRWLKVKMVCFSLMLPVPLRSVESLQDPKHLGVCDWQRENSVSYALALAGFCLSGTSHKKKRSRQWTTFRDLREEKPVVTNDCLKLKWSDACLQNTMKEPKEPSLWLWAGHFTFWFLSFYQTRLPFFLSRVLFQYNESTGRNAIQSISTTTQME